MNGPAMTSETASSGRWRDLGVRGLSAAVLIPVVLVDVWLGEWWFVAFVAVLMVLCAREYVRMAAVGDRLQLSLHAAGAIAGAVLPVAAGVAVAWAVIASLWVCSVIGMICLRCWGLVMFPFQPFRWLYCGRTRRRGLFPSIGCFVSSGWLTRWPISPVA